MIAIDQAKTLKADKLLSFRGANITNHFLTIAYLTPIVAPVLTFTVFSVTARNSNGQTTLDTARVFTSLSLFALLSDPLASLMIAVVQFAGAVGSFQRIQEFLESKERQDVRVKNDRNSGEETSTASTCLGSLPTDSDHEKVNIPKSTRAEITITGGTQNAFTIRDASFGWNDENPNVLSNLTMTIPQGSLTVIVGPVGCGKSTLLKGLLGELPKSSGTVEIAHSEIAYCDQTNWHMNSTISESIIGMSEMDSVWYQTVVQACALEEDFRQLSKGDNTQIGSSGTALSGGQSQRIVSAPVSDSRLPIP